jgi:hypothetical protein
VAGGVVGGGIVTVAAEVERGAAVLAGEPVPDTSAPQLTARASSAAAGATERAEGTAGEPDTAPRLVQP